MPFIEISKIINRRLAQSPINKKITAALVCDEFDNLIVKLLGEKIKNMAQAMHLKHKVLTIACLSPVVAQELKMRETELVDKINQKIGQQTVERLRLLT